MPTTKKTSSKSGTNKSKSSTRPSEKAAPRKKTSTAKASRPRKSASEKKYGPKAEKKIEKVMHEQKKGKLKSGRSGKKVTSRKQAIAIAISEARKTRSKVPKKKPAGARRKASASK